jgi:hypothetical protein
MTRKLVLSLAVLAIAAVPALASTSGTGTARITVKPAVGSRTTRFVLSFRAPQRTGRLGSSERQYILSASGPAGAGTCVSSMSMPLPASRARALARAVLNPATHGGSWCRGVFHGQIDEIEAPVCAKAELCPAFVLLRGTIGRFEFHVVRR